VKGTKTEGAMREKVPVKRFEVAEVENDAVPFGYGAIVERVLFEDREELIGASSRVHQPGVKMVAGVNSGGESSHGSLLLPNWMQLRSRGCAKSFGAVGPA
jgi:hypothetical protein